MTYTCEAVEKERQPVLSIRTRIPVERLPEALGNGYRSVYQYLSELGQPPQGPPFVAYYNMDMQDLDIEIGCPVGHDLPGKEDVQSGEIPAGKFATTLYTGPYPGMPPAYQALTEWVQAQGYQPTGVVYEHYLNDPGITPPEELKTLIVFPLR